MPTPLIHQYLETWCCLLFTRSITGINFIYNRTFTFKDIIDIVPDVYSVNGINIISNFFFTRKALEIDGHVHDVVFCVVLTVDM